MGSVAFREITFSGDPLEAYRRLGRGPGALLESARLSAATGRYSIAAKNPFLTFEAKGGESWTTRNGRRVKSKSGKPLEELKKLLRGYAAPGPEPFAGGAIGYFAYEAKRLVEPDLPETHSDTIGLPDVLFLFFEEGVVFDHAEGRVRAFARSTARLDRLARRLSRPAPKQSLRAERLPKKGIASSLSAEAFMDRVRRAKEHIRRGDIYQANLSQRLSFEVNRSAEQIYASLKKVNPSPFFGLLDAGSFQIVSGSPERLLRLSGRSLDTRPIAGTRSRGKTATADEKMGEELLLSEKERAEHVMLVDLERNDLGRVAEYGSVLVDELMVLENYSHVKHIVSNARARLREGLDAVDALAAFFPGGTITGAPKIRCMEIIDELEPVARGPYTGSLGYFSFAGDMDFNILIRSLVLKDKRAYLHVGAGIVADSDPRKEYDETLYKAQAVLTAVFGRAARTALRRLGLAGS